MGDNNNEDQQNALLYLDPSSTEKPPTRFQTYKNLVVVSMGFLFLFTAFQALSNLQTSIHDIKGLGAASLCVIYASLVLSCMFVPSLMIGKLGAKYTIMVAMVGYVLYILANFYPRWWTLIITSALLGFSGAPLWSAKCAYVTTTGIAYSELINKPKDQLITNFFGLFFLIFQSGQIWGNLISSQVLKPSGAKLNSTFDVAEICGANFCPGTEFSAVNQNPARSTVLTLMGIYLGFGVLAIIVIGVFLDKISIRSENEGKGSCHLAIATFKHLRLREMQLLVPLTLFSGLEQGFVFGDFTKSFVTCTFGIEKVGLVMICFGATDAVFSLLLGKMVAVTGRPIMMLTGAAVNLALLIFFLVWKPDVNMMYVYFISGALWGFSDAVWQTQVNAFYGVLFPTSQEAAFSNYRLWESLGFVIAFAYQDILCTDVKLYILIIVLVVSISLYGVIEMMRKREHK